MQNIVKRLLQFNFFFLPQNTYRHLNLIIIPLTLLIPQFLNKITPQILIIYAGLQHKIIKFKAFFATPQLMWTYKPHIPFTLHPTVLRQNNPISINYICSASTYDYIVSSFLFFPTTHMDIFTPYTIDSSPHSS